MNHFSGMLCEDKVTSQIKKNYLNKGCEETKETHENPVRAKYDALEQKYETRGKTT
jgi:hypothetical protein